MGKFFFLASFISRLLFLIAEDITKIVAFLIFDEACPKKNLILFFFNLSTFLLNDLSLP